MDRSGDGRFCAGAGLMAGLRAAEPFFQFQLIKHGYAASLLRTLKVDPRHALGPATWAVRPFSRFNLAGLNETTSVVLGMMSIAAIRHVYWALAQRPYYMHPGAGIGVAVYNGLVNLVNTLVLVYTCSKTPLSAQALGWKQYLGLALFAAGIAAEVLPEDMRRSFKQKPENKGKLYTEGAFGVIRHPLFLGYSLWRTGVALATGSVINGVAQLGFQIAYFAFFAIPQLDGHMSSRYKDKWDDYKQKVPHALVPYLL